MCFMFHALLQFTAVTEYKLKIATLLSNGKMLVFFSFSYVTFMIQDMQEEEIHSFLDLVNTTKSLPVFFFPVLCLCSTLEVKCMYKCLQLVGSL